MNSIKQQLLTDWHVARWIRLILGMILLVQAIATSEWFYGVVAVFLLYQVYTNSGCCGTNSCSIPSERNKPKDIPNSASQE